MGLETVELLTAIEERFGIAIPDHKASTLVTVGQMHEEIVRMFVANGRLETAALRCEVWLVLVEVMVRATHMLPKEVKPRSKWVGDITRYG